MEHDLKQLHFPTKDYKKNEVKNFGISNEQNNNTKAKNFNLFKNFGFCQNIGRDEKMFSNELMIENTKKELDFKSFFKRILSKKTENLHSQEDDSEDNRNEIKTNKFQTSQKKLSTLKNKKDSYQRNKPNSSHHFFINNSKNTLDDIELQQKKKKPYKYNIFKNYPPSEKTEKNSFDFDNRLNVKLGQNYKSPIKNSLSAPKRSYSFSQNENNDKFSNFSPNFLRLSQKYLKESNLAINNKANLILGEFLCINCDEFIDIDDMNTHSKICEKMPESKDLITINYKLEKTKTAVLINMKNETRLEKGLEECLHILINCIQKTICANHKVDDFVQVIDDLDDICKELYLHVTPKNRVYITLVNRIQELAIFKRQMVIHRKNKANQLNDDSYQKLNNQNKNQVINNNIIYSRKTTKKYSIINQDKKIFAPSTTHFAYVEQNENDWNRYFEKLDPNTIKYQQKKKSSKKIFRETENYKKNENFILAKPKEIFLAPKIISQRNIVISSKENYNESDNLKKIKSFLEERETQRSKFNEKISKLSIPEQYKDNNNCLILNGDLNRRKRFLELAKKLKDKMYPNKNPNDVSNSELYEECQNNQIHENNWKDFVEQKFKNSY